MHHVAYVYLPNISVTEVRAIFTALHPFGFRVSHIGKNDPPRKRAVSYDEAAELIIQHTGAGTNWSFVRDQDRTVELTFQIRDDPRWGYSTVSLSFPDSIPKGELSEALFRLPGAFACICGVDGGGKNQSWSVRLISEGCPDHLKALLGDNT